ncbi:MAG: ABC transporter permease [Candidatus Rokubacteria bacterium]|nr:ABC transporter permease [Candidatus Rokubacteria bacterium]
MRNTTVAFVVRRLLQLVPVVLAIAAMNFLLIKMAPGDAADILAGQMGHATLEFTQQLRREFGLDLPLIEQFLIYMGRLLTLDLGVSFLQQQPVLDLILDRLPATLVLMVTAISLAGVLGVGLGVAAARRQGSWIDNLVSVSALIIYATPAFWLGLMLIVLFSIKLDLLPSGGMMQIGAGKTSLAYALDVARHLILPAATLGLFYVAIYTRLMRAAMLEVYGLDFITAARAKGLSEGVIAWTHALRNALLPVVTLAGVQIGHLLGGSVLVETVFGWPGLGRLVFDALLQRDLNLLLGILLVSSVVVVIANLIVDLLYGLLDPRIVHK